MTGKAAGDCSLYGNCVFIGMWHRAAEAVSDVYDKTSLQDLVDDEAKRQGATSQMYSI
jgi:DNA-binding IscR family transcriptional regulator